MASSPTPWRSVTGDTVGGAAAGRFRSTSVPSRWKHAVAADPLYADTNLPASFLFWKAYTAFSAVVACSCTGSANSRDRARGSSFFPAAAAGVLLFDSLTTLRSEEHPPGPHAPPNLPHR